MSQSPTTGISRLSLESLPLRTRAHNQMDPSKELNTRYEAHGGDDDSMEEEEEEYEATIQSPTKLRYSLDRLSPETQKSVRSLWGETFEEPPRIALQWCDRMLDSEGNLDFYAFQIHEVVPRSVRIGSPKSKYSEPQCQCGRPQPCKHLIWLSDCIARQVLHDYDPREPLTLNEHGYPEELGQPLFRSIADMRLDILANGLHCDVGHPLSRTGPTSHRVADARGIVASVADIEEHVFDSYRSDLTSADFDWDSIVHRKDAEATLFSMLLASHRLSTWLRSNLRPSDPPLDQFRQLESRAQHILSDFDGFANASFSSTDSDMSEGPRDLEWAATSLKRCVNQVRTLIVYAESPLSPPERSSAARALVRILRGVVDRKDLYNHLLPSQDEGFVADTLEMLVDQTQYVDEIQDVMTAVGSRGASASWAAKMEAIIARMRNSRRSAATTRSSARRAEKARVSSPVLERSGHADSGQSSSGVGLGIFGVGSGSGGATVGTTRSGVRFMEPETPETAGVSSRGSRSGRSGGRGERRPAGEGASIGGAGSKRSAGTPSERGAKRAR